MRTTETTFPVRSGSKAGGGVTVPPSMALDAFHPDLHLAARLLPRGAIGPRMLRPVRIAGGLMARKPPKDVRVEAVGPISVRVHRPPSSQSELPALLWVHGGGYVLGTAAQEDAVCRRFAQEVGIVVASVEYRLAPEHKFPVPLDDCHAALVWLARQPYVDPGRIAVGGASAGGGLAAGLALLALERGEVAPAFQLLSYPMLDDRTATRTDIDETDFRLWNNKANRFGWQSYTGLAPGSSEISGLAAPARYEDLSGLPPAWIGVGTLDLFCDEDRSYAGRLRAAGVQCDLEIVEGAFHGFDSVRPKAGVTEAFRSSQVSALTAALRR